MKRIPTLVVDEAIDRDTFQEENLTFGRIRVAGLLCGYTGFSWAVHALVMWVFFRA